LFAFKSKFHYQISTKIQNCFKSPITEITGSAHKITLSLSFSLHGAQNLQLPQAIVNRTSSNCLLTKVQKPVKRSNQIFLLLRFFLWMGRELEMLKITRFITNNKNYFPFYPSKQSEEDKKW
jgi:hypothetical protein